MARTPHRGTRHPGLSPLATRRHPRRARRPGRRRLSAAASDLPGLAEALAGEIRLERELGRGGMGVVLLGREVALDRAVAVKVLPPDLARQPELRERFLREARTAAQLSHPNIVPVHRAAESGGYAWFSMGYVEGEHLGDRVRARGRLTPADAVRILREASWALAYAHARGLVHRDVKPENILLERASGRVLLTDFGIARDAKASPLTQDGMVMGSVHYMSPEQVEGRPLDGRSDLYALGVVGFFALSGTLPFRDAAAGAVLVAHATRPAPPLASVAPDVPATLCAVIDRCLAKDPAQRFETGEALADALGDALDRAGQTPAGGHSPAAVLSRAQADAVWLRAAQLQAEAAARIEEASRTGAITRVPASSDSEGYRVRDVQAAAQEVGIAPEFVALALSELPRADTPASAALLSPAEEKAARQLLGTDQRSIAVSRVIREAPVRVLEAFGRVIAGEPFQLQLSDTQGGHPLDGGILLLEIPDGMLTSTGTVNMFRYRMQVLRLKVLRVAFRPAADGRSCEVSLYGDLRPGARTNILYARWTAGTTGVGGGLLGLAVGASKKMLALAGYALAGPIGAGAALMMGGALVLYRYSYRSSVGEGTEELQRLLAQVEMALRGAAVFSAPPRVAVAPQSGEVLPHLMPPTPSRLPDPHS